MYVFTKGSSPSSNPCSKSLSKMTKTGHHVAQSFLVISAIFWKTPGARGAPAAHARSTWRASGTPDTGGPSPAPAAPPTHAYPIRADQTHPAHPAHPRPTHADLAVVAHRRRAWQAWPTRGAGDQFKLQLCGSMCLPFGPCYPGAPDLGATHRGHTHWCPPVKALDQRIDRADSVPLPSAPASLLTIYQPSPPAWRMPPEDRSSKKWVLVNTPL